MFEPIFLWRFLLNPPVGTCVVVCQSAGVLCGRYHVYQLPEPCTCGQESQLYYHIIVDHAFTPILILGKYFIHKSSVGNILNFISFACILHSQPSGSQSHSQHVK